MKKFAIAAVLSLLVLGPIGPLVVIALWFLNGYIQWRITMNEFSPKGR